jgi:hypothetical protein
MSHSRRHRTRRHRSARGSSPFGAISSDRGDRYALVTERLHSVERRGSRPPLYIMISTDRAGHVLHAAACDPEDYR